MSTSYLDTNVIIRYLTGDDLEKQAASEKLFQRVRDGELELFVPFVVVDEAVAVLSSSKMYGHSWKEVAELLGGLLRERGFRVEEKSVVLEALDLSGLLNVDFVDAVIYVKMRREGSNRVFSYDRHFNRFADIQRIEP